MITIDGRTYNVPGVYGTVEVVNLGAVALPVFNGLVIIGNARQGVPFSGGAGQEVINAFTSVSAARKMYGDCELTKAMAEAKKGGAGVMYALTPAKLTRATIDVKDKTSNVIFSVNPRLYGAPGNDIHLRIEYSKDYALNNIGKGADGYVSLSTTVDNNFEVGESIVINNVLDTDPYIKPDYVYTIIEKLDSQTFKIDLNIADLWAGPDTTGVYVSRHLVVEVIPLRTAKFLTKDVATAINVVSLDDVAGIYVDDPVFFADNDSASYQTAVIDEIDYENEKVKLNTTVDALAQSAYARMFVQDVDNTKTALIPVGNPKLVNDVIEYINMSGYLYAARTDLDDGEILKINEVDDFIGLLVTTPTDRGDSPIATEIPAGDWDELADKLPQLFEEFTNFTKARIRIINLVTPTARLHAKYLAIAKTLRSNPIQYSVQIVTGVDKNDIFAPKTSLNHPIKRAKALNDDDIILAAMGYDDKAAYISYAPQFAGQMSAFSVKRNLTNDKVLCQKVEKFFGGYNQESETSQFLANGLLVIKTGKNGFATVQGINTYQNQNNIWNEDDKKTYLIQQRQIVDFVYEGYKKQMEEGVGADDFDETKATAKGLAILDEYLAGGFITKRKISDAYRKGNAIYTHPEIVPLPATDFVGFILRVVIEN